MDDQHRRSFAKAVSWRFVGTFITSLLVLVFTGQWMLSFGIGVLDFVTKIFVFYAHERLWLVIPWGIKE